MRALRWLGERAPAQDDNGREDALRAIATAFPGLALALRTYLARTVDAYVYDQPAAFTAFIQGGGNVGLYEAVSAALAERYRRHGIDSLLDIGCGNGQALIAALALARAVPIARVGLIEPALPLLEAARPGVIRSAPGASLYTWAVGLEQFLDTPVDLPRWALCQSTFALQAIAPQPRWHALARLRDRIERLCIIEFDVPDHLAESDDHLLSLAARYERAIGEYGPTRELVSQGFLIPMLIGQLGGQSANTNWEHPAEHWKSRLSEIGYRNAAVRRLHDYFWSPAFLLTADP
ncbi:hypothetical protein AC028_03295 [Xanthomonas citri pv. aurantifolii]|nr:hypothetical protein AC028_03295 [Xanthomonas citri pv. aurantifolii]ARE58907.1 hypothetical protein TP45_18320 [Xanthomonas citri pv. aurantifolii]